jgi:hypothetical protein
MDVIRENWKNLISVCVINPVIVDWILQKVFPKNHGGKKTQILFMQF